MPFAATLAIRTNIKTYTTIKDASTYTLAATNTDGLGRVIATSTEHHGSSGGYKAQTTVYDKMGRVKKQFADDNGQLTARPTHTGFPSLNNS